MLKRLKRILKTNQQGAAQAARTQCLQIVDEAIANNDDIPCWNYTAKYIRDKIAALDQSEDTL